MKNLKIRTIFNIRLKIKLVRDTRWRHVSDDVSAATLPRTNFTTFRATRILTSHFASDFQRFYNAPSFAYRLFQSKSHAHESRERVVIYRFHLILYIKIRVNIECAHLIPMADVSANSRRDYNYVIRNKFWNNWVNGITLHNEIFLMMTHIIVHIIFTHIIVQIIVQINYAM